MESQESRAAVRENRKVSNGRAHLFADKVSQTPIITQDIVETQNIDEFPNQQYYPKYTVLIILFGSSAFCI